MKMNPLACGEVLMVASRLRQTAVKTKLASHQRVLAMLCQVPLERVSGGNRAGTTSPPQEQDIPAGCWGEEMQGQGALLLEQVRHTREVETQNLSPGAKDMLRSRGLPGQLWPSLHPAHAV